MMDVKDTGANGVTSITSMLVRNAIAKNHEMKELLEKPAREEESREVRKADESTQKSEDASAEKESTQANPNVGKLVNVNV